MEPPRLSRVVAHSLWLTTAVGAQLVFLGHLAWSADDSDPDLGRGPAGALLFLVLGLPFWAPACLIAGALAGTAAGLAARAGARLRAGVRTRTVAGAMASGLVLGLLVLALAGRGSPDPRWPGYVAVFCTIGLVTGGSAVLVAQTERFGRADRSRALGWGLAALGLGSLALLAGGMLWLGTPSWVIRHECAERLGVDELQVAWAQVPFPPQLWCLSGDTALRTVPAWQDALVVTGGTAALVCAAVAVGTLPGSRATARSLAAVSVAIGLVGAAGVALSLTQRPPADAVERARVAATRVPEPSPSAPASPTGPPPTPSAEPTTTLPAATSALAELGRIARVGRTDLVWPADPRVSSATCQLPDGRSGRLLSLTGRFTTRDMADVHGPAEVLEVSRANEAVAAQLVEDWLASGLLVGTDVIHGEWYLGTPGASPIESAHVGFTEAVGEFRVVSHCASR